MRAPARQGQPGSPPSAPRAPAAAGTAKAHSTRGQGLWAKVGDEPRASRDHRLQEGDRLERVRVRVLGGGAGRRNLRTPPRSSRPPHPPRLRPSRDLPPPGPTQEVRLRHVRPRPADGGRLAAAPSVMLLPPAVSARLAGAPGTAEPLPVERDPAAGAPPFRFAARPVRFPRDHEFFEDGDVQRHLYLQDVLTQVAEAPERSSPAVSGAEAGLSARTQEDDGTPWKSARNPLCRLPVGGPTATGQCGHLEIVLSMCSDTEPMIFLRR
uniref:Uncharacterized protein n=1 Tax=Castor canadensis TaxID=51338 RepID=A0A8C0ZLQ3_CASCN